MEAQKAKEYVPCEGWLITRWEEGYYAQLCLTKVSRKIPSTHKDFNYIFFVFWKGGSENISFDVRLKEDVQKGSRKKVALSLHTVFH